MRVTAEEINRMSRETFVERFGAVLEHSPWVAEQAWASRPFASAGELHARMMSIVLNAPEEKLLALIRAHPDLATRMGIGSLTAYSAKEQQGAGLDRLTPEEFETFSSLNAAYMERFGFPFIFAVKGRGKDDILAAMRERVGHSPEDERKEALEQIGRIAAFRLADLIAE